MITLEEYGQMKEQLLQMSDEHEMMENQIQKLQAQNSQLPLLRKQLADSTAALKKLEDEFTQTQLKLNEEFDRLSDMDAIKTPEIKLNEQKEAYLQEQLTKMKQKYDGLFDEENQIMENLANAAAQENDLTILIDDADKKYAKYEVLVHQLQTCRMMRFHIEDMLENCDHLRIEREAQHGRRYRLNGWKQQASVINQQQVIAHNDLIKDFNEKAKELQEEERKLSEVYTTQASCQSKLSDLEIEISQLEKSNSEASQTTHAEIEKERDEIQKLKQKLASNKSEISEMRNTIQNYNRSEAKAIQKKIGMVRDLEKRLIQERKNLPVIQIDSPYVEELTRTVDAEMREREKILFEVRDLEKELKRVRADSDRKTVVIEEFSTVRPSDEPLSDEVCYRDFLNLLKEAEIKHVNYVSDLQGIAELVACAQQEMDVLRETLSELSH